MLNGMSVSRISVSNEFRGRKGLLEIAFASVVTSIGTIV